MGTGVSQSTLPSLDELEEMRQHRTGGRSVQRYPDVDVHHLDHAKDRSRSIGELLEHLCFPLEVMCEQAVTYS